MRFMKWIGWLLKLGATVVAVSVLTMATTGYVVNSYVQSLLGSYNLPITGQAPSLGSMMKGMLGLGGGQSAPDNESAVTDDSHEGENTEPQTDETNGTAPDGALPVMGELEAGGDALAQDNQVVVTPDDLVAKKDDLPDQEKEEIFAILMSKLPQEDMQQLTNALEDGLTETEMINIEQILSKHLDKAEYAKVIEMLKE
ncbi:hypothetical protein [Paenibacillus senegalimassiliensis]|uniref:hypothetical protein n=1 Tax=Paenibacillus senegalimassiliensis TaxID=1737426 RepID=UPI00073E3D2F|nr:hypothetical protein [Paenibacillus senegalimassiliensis]